MKRTKASTHPGDFQGEVRGLATQGPEGSRRNVVSRALHSFSLGLWSAPRPRQAPRRKLGLDWLPGPALAVVGLVGCHGDGKLDPPPPTGTFPRVSHSGAPATHHLGQSASTPALRATHSNPASHLCGVSGPSFVLRKLMGVTSCREPRCSLPGTGLPGRGLGVGDTLCGEKVLALGWDGRWAVGGQA